MGGGKNIIEARVKLSERPIVWKEAYTKRTLFLKKQFHDVLGPGSYFRFEGHDTDSNDDYFVVVGPAKVHSPKAEYFAGVRKLPADYAAGGLYFNDLEEAMQYAHETWGVSIPQEIRYYDSSDLKGIDEKIKKWKEVTEDENKDKDYLSEWYDSIKSREEKPMSVNSSSNQQYFYAQSNTYPFFTKIAMPTWLRHEQGFQWWSVDDMFSGSDQEFQAALDQNPSLAEAKNLALKEKAKRQKQIAEMYGVEYSSRNAGMYAVWLVHRGDRGTYIVSVGPYCGNRFEQALDKFGVFTKKLNEATDAEIQAEVQNLIKEYAEKYGVQLTENDFKVPKGGSLNPSIDINKSGRQKVYGSPEWKSMILDRYGVLPGPGMTTNLKRKYEEQVSIWKRALDEAYAVSQENGEAFERQQPPPPSINLIRRRIGQQQSRSILRQNVKNLSKLEQVEKYGFDSIQEAVEFLETTGMQGAPIGEIPPTTSEDLKAARKSKEKDQVAQKPNVEIKRDQKKIENPKEELVEEKTMPEEILDNFKDGFDPFASSFAGSSMLNLIKLAEDLDSKGKHRQAEEIHAILRKHIEL